MEIQNVITINDAELIELSAGRRPELVVGTLPLEVRRYLGCSRETIFLSDQSVRHIVQKHGDHIGHNELKHIPKILFVGVWLADERRTNAIASCEVDGVRYKVVIKVTKDRRRTYVKTLHRTSARQTRALLRNTTRLRDGWFG
jgi:hypothetical protein